MALVVGGITAAFFNEVTFGLGPRMAMLVAAIFYVLAALFLRPVDPRRWEVVHGGGLAVAPLEAGPVAVGEASAAPTGRRRWPGTPGVGSAPGEATAPSGSSAARRRARPSSTEHCSPVAVSSPASSP